MQGHVVEEQALQITHDISVSKPRRGGSAFRGRGRGRGRQSFDKSLVECFYCHDLGHFQYECPKKGKEKESQAHYAETTEPLLLMAHVKKAPDETAWFLDSGCSNHMCGHKEFFSELDESFRKTVKLGDNSSIGVMGKGRIHLQVNHVSQVITEDEAIANNSGGTGDEEGSRSISADNRFHDEILEHQTAEEQPTADRISSPAERRSRHPPIWMRDYDSGEVLPDDDHQGFKMDKDSAGMAVDSTMYMQMVGSLMYLTSTRPDIMFVVSLLSRYLAHPTALHLQAVKRVLRYIKGTLTYGIFYKKGGNKELLAYTDSDYAGDLEDRKSTSGFSFLLSSGAVSWSSKKQPVVTLSTTEAEFIAAASCACQAVWLRRMLEQLNHASTRATGFGWLENGGNPNGLFEEKMCRMRLSFFSADLKKKMPKHKKTKQQNGPDFDALERRVLEMF
ncbi:hypothetical protein MRB53_003956 [Persea americana]|uniref:Uncharacterized protein n=1 Tax=Persea americana TaxID=3435 RepID=A0ACC2MZ59_PERAE|nr:hypothetical protein MRB53_003956 [Persea americana]